MTTKRNKFRSKLEQTFFNQYKKNIAGYESISLPYVIEHKYTPDFDFGNNTYIETKGIFDSADRTKIKQVLKQHPHIRIILVFQNPKLKISKASKTTYADWCNKNNITWFDSKNVSSIQKFIDTL